MHFVSYWKFGGGGDIGANLVSQAAAKINYLAGNGTTTSVILAQGLIVEGSCSCANPVLITRGIEKTTKALVTELKLMSQEVEDGELANIAAVSAVSYPLKVTANNAGVDGNVVSEKVLNLDDHKYGYNAATGNYEDLMVAGIIDPAKVSEVLKFCKHIQLELSPVKLFADGILFPEYLTIESRKSGYYDGKKII
ncbi:chaperonin 60 subunit beta 3, chloroplastic-like isoform X1 [Apium graveolens]|uniref:chaperonin 60 subunit beta 3, chloroplastic-like isoform X1 n=1 Tax=Apium graveolens TaxID=4045 RepID=UPI003D7B7E68